MRMNVHRLETWRAAPLDRGGLYFQPTLRSLPNRLMAAFVFGLVAAGCLYAANSMHALSQPSAMHPEFQQTLRNAEAAAERMAEQLIREGAMTPEEFQRIRETRRREAEASRSEGMQTNQRIRDALLAIGGILLAIAILAPLALLWERAWVEADAAGGMLLTRRNMLGIRMRRAYPRGVFEHAAVRVRENMQRTRQLGLIQRGWLWEILLLGREGVVFCVDHSPNRPLSNGKMPDQVRLCAERLAYLAACPLRPGYSVAEAQIRRGFMSDDLSYREEMPLEVTRYEGNLDELSPKARASLAEALRQGGPAYYTDTRSTSLRRMPDGSYRLDMPDGSTRTCASLDELPPDLRELIRRHGIR